MRTAYRTLGRQRRNDSRKVARRIYVDDPVLCVNAVDSPADRENLRQRVIAALRKEAGYQSIVASILLSLFLRYGADLVWALILKWIEQKLTHPPSGGFQAGEPGA